MFQRCAMAVIVMLLVVALAIPLATFADHQEAGKGSGKASGRASAMTKDEGRERHPEIREALRKLQNVKRDLTKEAAHDFQGHRVKAIEHIEQAISELKLALQVDKD